jgi:hypothetical protein
MLLMCGRIVSESGGIASAPRESWSGEARDYRRWKDGVDVGKKSFIGYVRLETRRRTACP